MEMMKTAVRQQRYKLKREYFDLFPLHLVSKTPPIKSMSNEKWIDVVESWKTPKKMVCFITKNQTLALHMLSCTCLTCILSLMQETCQKNKDNRGSFKFHQTSYWILQLPGSCGKFGMLAMAAHLLACCILYSLELSYMQ